MELWTLESTNHNPMMTTTTTVVGELWGGGVPSSPSTSSSTLPPYITPHIPEDNATLAFSLNETCQYDYRQMDLTEFDYDYRKETWIPITWREIIKIVAYVIVFLVSLAGNLLVIVVVYYNAHMRTSTNQYLVNLAVADLLVTLVCMWVHIVRNLSHPHYVLPALVCKLDGFAQATSLLASVLTLTVISVGRFVAVMFPLHARTSPDRAHRVIAVVWITSALLACPTLFYRELYSIQWANFTSRHCDEFWPMEVQFDPSVKHCVITYDAKKLFYTILTIAFYFLPVGIMFINYSLVVWRLWMTQMPGEHCVPSRNTATRAKKKVVKMVSVVLLIFVLCWTPLQSIILYSNFVHAEHNSLPEWFSVMEFSAYFVAYSNSALNPIIYCGFNANFRQGLVSLLTCRHASAGRIYHRRHWKGMTGGTRETTVGCSGPEPAVLLEFNSFKRNRLDQKCSMTSSHSGRVVMTSSNKDLCHNNLNDLASDHTCKNYNGGEHSHLEDHTAHGCPSITNAAMYNNHRLHRCELGVAGHQEGRPSTRTSNSWSNNSDAAVGCGCCKSAPANTTASPLHHHHQLCDLNHLKESDVREDKL